jgi:hypothetical protein
VNWTCNAERMRAAAAIAAAVLLLGLASVAIHAQRRNEFRSGSTMRVGFAQNRPRPAQPGGARPFHDRNRNAANQPQQKQPQNGGARLASGYHAYDQSNPGYSRPAYRGGARPGYDYPGAAPPGHLGDWLNQHRGVPVQQQERLLRKDPSFDRLPAGQQQRLVQQLHQLNQMPPQQRERRLARSEMLERMSPQEQMQVRQAGRSFMALPPDRQAVVRRAFQDLRSVPLDQRGTVLNSERYQRAFTPGERSMLSNLLSAEPYQPPR